MRTVFILRASFLLFYALSHEDLQIPILYYTVYKSSVPDKTDQKITQSVVLDSYASTE